MKNSKSLMDIEDICGCSKLPSIIPRKELPHLRSTSAAFMHVRDNLEELGQGGRRHGSVVSQRPLRQPCSHVSG
ncbi:MAGUK p55 subfamily member 6 isoform X1 [Apis mellifera carnica]|nr:MAGUK p55 subfamily member 6 isoform X1 [Apis mellifera carnica]